MGYLIGVLIIIRDPTIWGLQYFRGCSGKPEGYNLRVRSLNPLLVECIRPAQEDLVHANVLYPESQYAAQKQVPVAGVWALSAKPLTAKAQCSRL